MHRSVAHGFAALLCIAFSTIVLGTGCQRQRDDKVDPYISEVTCSSDGSVVCIGVTSLPKMTRRLVSISLRSGEAPRETELERGLLPPVLPVPLSPEGAEAYFCSMPYPRPPYRQSLIAINLASARSRTLADFDVRTYPLTQPAGITPTGDIICARDLKPDEATRAADKTRTDFVAVDSSGRVKALTPAFSPEMWGELPRRPRLHGIVGGKMGLSIGRRVFLWPMGDTKGRPDDANVLWRMPNQPYETAIASDGSVAAVIPDDVSTPTAGQDGAARLFLHSRGISTVIAHGMVRPVISFSPRATRLAFVNGSASGLGIVDLSDKRAYSAKVPFSVGRKVTRLRWLTEDALVFATQQGCFVYNLDGTLQEIYTASRQ